MFEVGIEPRAQLRAECIERCIRRGRVSTFMYQPVRLVRFRRDHLAVDKAAPGTNLVA